MNSAATRLLPRALKQSSRRSFCPQCRRLASSSPTTPQAPPLLLKLRADLKTAMKSKDGNRLNVLKGILAEITNSSKTNNPIQTDMQLLSLLRKRSASAKAASDEFKAAGRADLVEKEQNQVEVLDEYAGGVQTMSLDDIRSIVTKVVQQVKAQGEPKISLGDVMKKLVGPGGELDGKPVDKKEVSMIVSEVVKSS